MNRRKFFKSLAIGAAAVVVVPKLLIPKPKLDGYSVLKPTIHGIKLPAVLGWDTGRGTLWVRVEDWQAINSWYATQEQIMLERMRKYYDIYNYSIINLGI